MALHRKHGHAKKPEQKIAVNPVQKKKPLITPLRLVIILVVLCVAGILAYFAFPHGPSAASGDSVSVDYIGTLENGNVFDTNIEAEAKKASLFDSTRSYEPMTFRLGSGQVIPGFDKGIVGMKVGETKKVTIRPEDAYGYPQESQIQNVTIPSTTQASLEFLRSKGINETLGTETQTVYGLAVMTAVNDTTATFELRPTVGETVYFPDGFSAKIASVYPSAGALTITFDANHPLAGQVLIFEITLKTLTKA
jgi:FKBP-type peptidyl-prolyl cis-trans isomerase 2